MTRKTTRNARSKKTAEQPVEVVTQEEKDLLGLIDVDPAEAEPQIICDFSQVNRVWRKMLLRKGVQAAEGGDDMFDLLDDLTKMAAQVLKYVSPHYLVSDAPDPRTIDWSDPESMDKYIRADVQIEALVANELRESSKNLLGG